MAVVMQQWGSPNGSLPRDGWYLKDFDFEAHKGRGEISLTPDKAEAKRFETMEEAIAFYRASPKCRPKRADGKPNRPLTAANWQFEQLA
jgi:hypothetical protein